MIGLLRLILVIAIIASAGYGLHFIWTGEWPPYEREVLGTAAVVAIVVIGIALLTLPRDKR
jgi:hypothetical protein